MPEYIWGFAGYFEVWSNTMMIYIFIVSTLWFIFEFLSYCYTLFLHSALFSVLNLTFRAQQWDFSVFWCNTLLWNFTVGQWMWDVHRDSLLLFHWKQKLTNWNLEFWIKNIKKIHFFGRALAVRCTQRLCPPLSLEWVSQKQRKFVLSR